MGDALTGGLAGGVFGVDVHGVEVTGDPGEGVHVALGDGLARLYGAGPAREVEFPPHEDTVSSAGRLRATKRESGVFTSAVAQCEANALDSHS